MSLYSDGIVFKFRFQKGHFTPKNREWADIFWTQCTVPLRSNETVAVFKQNPHSCEAHTWKVFFRGGG